MVWFVQILHLLHDTMICQSWAKHVFFEVLHVQLSIHGGMVLSWGVLYFVSALMNVKCLVCMHDLNRLINCYTKTLCLEILSLASSIHLK